MKNESNTAEHQHRQRNDRAICGSCQKSMVPRLRYDRGSLVSSLCPFCGSVYKDLTAPPGFLDVMFGYCLWGVGILGLLWILVAMIF